MSKLFDMRIFWLQSAMLPDTQAHTSPKNQDFFFIHIYPTQIQPGIYALCVFVKRVCQESVCTECVQIVYMGLFCVYIGVFCECVHGSDQVIVYRALLSVYRVFL